MARFWDHRRVLDDGTYDAFAFDVEAVDDGVLRLSLTIVAGPHKGEVVTVTATGLGDDPVALLGMPATLTVTGGQPAVTFDQA